MTSAMIGCSCRAGSICSFCACLTVFVLQAIIALAGLSLGLFLMMRPARAIEMQRRFYEKINWRIEPVSIDIELRNMRIMGAILVAVVLAMAVAGKLGSY